VTYLITEACIGVKEQSCLAVCPVDCIHESESLLVIDPEECIDCGACEPECPVDAIFPDTVLPANLSPYLDVNAVWTSGGGEAVEAKLTEINDAATP
jgi:ferredoxin